MKKILSFILLAATVGVTAQILETDNYNSYAIGNVGTDPTGTTAGQGGMYTGASGTNGTNSDYQIVSVDAAHINSLQVKSGTTGASASNRTVYKNGLDVAWTNRTAGNNVIKGTLVLYTGTSTGAIRAGSRLLTAGSAIIVGISYDSSSKNIVGVISCTNTSTAAVTVPAQNITAAGTFPANTWVSVGYTYDPVNATATYIINGTSYTVTPTAGTSITPNLVPAKHQIYDAFIASNTVGTTSAVDNYTIEAISSATLSANEVSDKKLFSISPNPTSDYLTIKSKEKIKSVSVFDLSGRKMNVKYDGNGLNVQNLEKGNYILTIQTDQSTVSKEFVKK